MECYICHELVKIYEYRNHVASHLTGNITGVHPQAFPTFSSYDTGGYDHHATGYPAQSTPTRIQTRNAIEHIHHREAPFTLTRAPVRSTAVPTGSQQETQSGQPTQPDAFRTWLADYARDFRMYTTIDGQKNDSDVDGFRQAAQMLRGTTKNEVVKIVQRFEGFPSSSDQKTCLELVRKAPIFPGLVAYTYTHLVTCPRRKWVYNDDWSDKVYELRQLVERCTKFGDMWCILSCDKIKQGLLKILRETKVRDTEHRCNSALLNGTMVLGYDIFNLAALVATGTRSKDILEQKGTQVGKLIELFHDLLESGVDLEDGYRRRFLGVLIRLSKDSGSCPRGFDITEGTISILQRVGGGGFGYVFKGKLGSCLVAVKALKRRDDTSLPDYNKQLSKEAIVWRYLRHPNCLPMYGIYSMPTEGPNISIALVSPWMEQGTLSSYLKHKPKSNRTKLILDVVRGLHYLHTLEPHVAHRDIKPDNILITKKGNACLADFGLVSTFDTNNHLHTAASEREIAGTYSYMAPELFHAMESRDAKREVNARACDMYALGCTIYAAYTDRPPLCGPPPPEVAIDKIPRDMQSFVENLCDQEPKKRMTAEMTLAWMEFKASHEDIDLNLGLLCEEEWEWKSRPDDQSSIWSVSL